LGNTIVGFYTKYIRSYHQNRLKNQHQKIETLSHGNSGESSCTMSVGLERWVDSEASHSFIKYLDILTFEQSEELVTPFDATERPMCDSPAKKLRLKPSYF
jgi:adenosylmethionine-8-amino-7-oxononanoate aminotransferase